MRAQCLRGTLVMDASSGATSGPVRVSYFDPRTGEPCDAKPEPLHGDQERRIREREGYRASLARGWKRRAVLVDGVEYESISAAAGAVKADKTTLGSALRSWATEFRGHAVGFAEPAQEPVERKRNPRNSSAVEVDGRRYATIMDAAVALGYSPTYLAAQLRKGRTEYGGRVVRYADRPTPERVAEPPKPRRKPTPPHRTRPVTVDGTRYATVKEAAEAMGCVPGTIHNALKAGRELVKGHVVAYA